MERIDLFFGRVEKNETSWEGIYKNEWRKVLGRFRKDYKWLRKVGYDWKKLKFFKRIRKNLIIRVGERLERIKNCWYLVYIYQQKVGLS